MDARYTHNLISKPHSVPPYTPYTTELVVAGIFTICSSDSDYEEGDSDFEFAAEILRMNKYYLFLCNACLYIRNKVLTW